MAEECQNLSICLCACLLHVPVLERSTIDQRLGTPMEVSREILKVLRNFVKHVVTLLGAK